MTTYYTSPVLEKEGYTFEEFLWRCAGAYFRDGAVPDEVEVDPHHKNQVCAWQVKYLKLKELSPADVEREYEAFYQRRLKEHAECEASNLRAKKRYQAMLEKVASTEPPSAEHGDLWTFMKDQLTSSLEHDCHEESPPPAREDPHQLHAETLLRAEQSIKYHEAEWKREVEQAATRQKWLKALRKAFPQPKGKP